MIFNWIDAIIAVFVLYQIYLGWSQGVLFLGAQFLSFVLSLYLSLRFHAPVGDLLHAKLGISAAWTGVLGYTVLAFLSQIILEEIIVHLVSRAPSKVLQSTLNRALGAIVSTANALMIVAFFLLFILAIPIKGSIKSDIRSSYISTPILSLIDRYAPNVRDTLSGMTKQALTFLTVAPGSSDTVPIQIPKGLQFSLDESSEKKMLSMLNTERVSRGGQPLRLDSDLTSLARAKSMDMFERRYFSHIDPDGRNISDRAKQAGVSYMLIGENLAYAPDVSEAHMGLMNSEGHRKNILDTRYSRIGIGVVDGGIYGKMFTQVFAD